MPHDRDAALKLIRFNIKRYGYHVYSIGGGASPNYYYTIGLSPLLGAELIIAGASYYSPNQQLDVLRELSRLAERLDATGTRRMLSTTWGDFDVAAAHPSWSAQLALGVFDYYSRDVEVWAVSPTGEARTIDVADMTVPWQADTQPVWRWIGEKWPYDVSEDSVAVTNLAAMRGAAITDGLRRSSINWELFVDSDPDKPQDGVLVVPLGTLLGFDPTLAAFTHLAVGEGLTRKPGHPWMSRHTAN
jgi:hypothetical protein